MVYTKILNKNSKWNLLVKDAYGKYKVVYYNKLKSKVISKREELRSNSIKAQAALDMRTVVEVYEEYSNQRMEDALNTKSALKVSSVNRFPRWFKRWIRPHFENKMVFPSSILIRQLNIDIAKTWFKEIRKSGCSIKVAFDVANSLTTVLKYAVEKQYIDHVGSLSEWKPKKDKALLPIDSSEYKKTKTVMINRQEVARLLTLLTPTNNEDIKSISKYVIVSCLVFLGVRMSELIAFKWKFVNLETGTWDITHTVVEGLYAKSVKADGSERSNVLPTELWTLLKAWKIVHNKHFGKNVEWIFPSFGYYNVPVTEKVVRDWLVLAYQDLGLAKVEIRKSSSGDNKAYLKVLWSKFKGSPSKTFRHFASTALLNHQQADPIVLNDNFIKGYIGHLDIKTTKTIYGDHNDLDNTSEQFDKQRSAVDNAIGIKTTDGWKELN